jgi:hypothetical protein
VCSSDLFNNISHIDKFPEDTIDDFNEISFLFINNRKNENISNLIDKFYDKINDDGFIGGDCYEKINILNAKVFDNGYWVIRKIDFKVN